MKTFVLEISQVDPLSFLQKDWTRVGLGVIAAFLTLFALATGHRNVLAIATTAWTLSATSVFVGPMMSVRGFTLLILGFHVGNFCTVSCRPTLMPISGCSHRCHRNRSRRYRMVSSHKSYLSEESGQFRSA